MEVDGGRSTTRWRTRCPFVEAGMTLPHLGSPTSCCLVTNRSNPTIRMRLPHSSTPSRSHATALIPWRQYSLSIGKRRKTLAISQDPAAHGVRHCGISMKTRIFATRRNSHRKCAISRKRRPFPLVCLHITEPDRDASAARNVPTTRFWTQQKGAEAPSVNSLRQLSGVAHSHSIVAGGLPEMS